MKHLTNQSEIVKNISLFLSLSDHFKNSYFMSAPVLERQRREYVEQYSMTACEFSAFTQWWTLSFNVELSGSRVYVHKLVSRNGIKTNTTALKQLKEDLTGRQISVF